MRSNRGRPPPSTEYAPEEGATRAIRQLRRLQNYLRGRVRPFRSDAQLLDLVGALHAARDSAHWIGDGKLATRLRTLERTATRKMQQAIRRSPARLVLARTVRHHRLDHVETRCLLLLALAALGSGDATTLGEVQSALAAGGGTSIRVRRALSSDGRLARTRIVCMDEAETVALSSVRLHPELLQALLGHRRDDTWRKLGSQEQLFVRMRPLCRAMAKLAVEFDENDSPVSSNLARAVTRRDHLLNELLLVLEDHLDWSISELRIRMSPAAFGMLLVLIGQELGYETPSSNAYTGRALAAAVSDHADEIVTTMRQLAPNGHLRSNGLVRVCSGEGDVGNVDDAGALATCTFELTQHAVKLLGLSVNRRRRTGVREPLVRLDQLVLSERVEAAVRMALVQAGHADTLFRTWGLGATIPYGRGTTLLFTGPPGVGKTATAEAIAHALGRPILLTNAADIQRCWVGETEKAIVRAFREAEEAGAVLFWDEADAFFHDREQATRQWEVREVNVLLQEVERFEGVCILATNRKCALDTALERRVSLKVEFERPDRGMARAIWTKLLPAKLPLARDVDLDALAATDLAGGQIKNVVLNAARRALLRGTRARVTMDDFMTAVESEADGQWTRKERVGFGTG